MPARIPASPPARVGVSAGAALEPPIAREAACLGLGARLRLNVERATQTASWREYEALDNEFHGQSARLQRIDHASGPL